MPPAAPRTATLADEAVVLENDRAPSRRMALVARRLKIIPMKCSWTISGKGHTGFDFDLCDLSITDSLCGNLRDNPPPSP